jgi:hypothetical protein
MNPYLQNSLQPQLQEIGRQYDITGTQQMSNATRAGAFGGTREALMASENQRNKNTAMNQAIGTGYNNAFQAAQQAQQFGANLGLQGQQAALQGYGQAGQAGSTLGQLGASQLGAQQGIINTQTTAGNAQQSQEQNKINQAIQNYAQQQQMPLQSLSNLSGLLHGLPLQNTTTQRLAVWYKDNPQGFGSSTPVNTNNYFNAVISWSTNGALMTFNFYLNGVVANTTTVTQSGYNADASTITLGQNANGALSAPSENSSCAFSSLKSVPSSP